MFQIRCQNEKISNMFSKWGIRKKKYMDENDISLIIDKKNLLAGKSDLDLTDIIIQKLNLRYLN